MQREFKFRFFDKALNKIIYRQPLTYDFSHTDIIPMMFTGLKDKNGKDIYEGDVLSKEWYNNREIWFENGTFMIGIQGSSDCIFYDIIATTCEVVGNIYENPELLTH